ncbi:MAG: hypothetical protein [Caudoviricetes sp.]|nr:MAG: hypothetical protein [Caudoviricetes sp.]
MNDELNGLLKARGWLTIDEQLAPQAMDAFWAHATVRTLAGLDEWVTQERQTYLRLKARHDVGLIELTPERYDEILGKLVMLHSFHANIRQVRNNEQND